MASGIDPEILEEANEIMPEYQRVKKEEDLTPLDTHLGGYILKSEWESKWIQSIRKARSVANDIEEDLKKIPWRDEEMTDIAGEIAYAKNFSDADQYLLRQMCGLGKTSIGLSMTDLHISHTQEQIHNDKQDWHDIHGPDAQAIQLISFDLLLGTCDDYKKKHIPQEVKNLWSKEQKAVKKLRKYHENLSFPSDVTSKYKNQMGKNEDLPKILKRWEKQFSKKTWRNYTIFATPKRLRQLKDKVLLRQIKVITVDEGLQSAYSLEHGIKDIYDFKNQVTRKYEPEIDSLDKKDFDELGKLASKILDETEKHAQDQPTQRGFGMTLSPRAVCDHELINSFRSKWRSIGRSKSYGTTALTGEFKELLKEGKLWKMQRLNNMRKKFQILHDSLNIKWIFYKSDSISFAIIKPAMYELWEITEKKENDADIFVLDATMQKERIEHLYRKFRQSYEDPLVEIDWAYIGEGNFEKKDVSYDQAEPEDFNDINYRHYVWDWNIKKKNQDVKASVPFQTTKNSKMVDELERVIRKLNETNKVGVIAHKHLCERFSDCSVISTNFSKSAGSNKFKDVDELFVIGQPPVTGLLTSYLKQIRELPSYLPDNNPNMRKVSKYGGLETYLDCINEYGILEETGTMWHSLFEGEISKPVFDAYLRRRPYVPGKANVHGIGPNAYDFLPDDPKPISELIKENTSNKELVRDWEDIECKSLYRDREVIAKIGTSHRLKNCYRKWRELEESNLTLDVSLVLDRSGSMSGDKLDAAKNGSKTLVDSLNSSDKSALVSFSSSATLDQELTSNKTEVKNAIEALSATGGTDIGTGISRADQELINGSNARANASKVMVVLSDGQGGDPIQEANASKQNGVRIITIALGDGADEQTLRQVASSDEDALVAPNSTALEDVFEEVSGTICEPATESSLDNGILLDADPSTDEVEPFENSTTRYIGFKWELPREVGNEVQSDEMQFDLNFHTEQARHNDNPQNPFQ